VITTEIGGRPLATLNELQTVYSVADLFDLLETIEAHGHIAKIVRSDNKRDK